MLSTAQSSAGDLLEAGFNLFKPFKKFKAFNSFKTSLGAIDDRL